MDPLSNYLPNSDIEKLDDKTKIKIYIYQILGLHLLISLYYKDISDYLMISYLLFILYAFCLC
jgi:hypothetical protein